MSKLEKRSVLGAWRHRKIPSTCEAAMRNACNCLLPKPRFFDCCGYYCYSCKGRVNDDGLRAVNRLAGGKYLV